MLAFVRKKENRRFRKGRRNMFKYQIGLYMRLSKEDEYSHVESNSITMQRMLLHSYVREHFPDADVTEFVDDGYSGTNFERPGGAGASRTDKRPEDQLYCCERPVTFCEGLY